LEIKKNKLYCDARSTKYEEMKSVYSAVWTGSLCKAVCALSVKG